MFSKPKHKSGAQKRKERKEQEESKAKMSKLDKYFTAQASGGSMPAASSSSTTTEPEVESTPPPPPTSPGGQKSVPPEAQELSTPRSPPPPPRLSSSGQETSSPTPPPQSESDPGAGAGPGGAPGPGSAVSDSIPSTSGGCDDPVVVGPRVMPTDRGHYDMNKPPDADTKSYIIATGSCRPTGPFPRDRKQGDRCFSEKYYTTTTKAGIKLQRSWLCYSPTLDCAYCEPCWLFADRGAPFFNDAWIKGVRDWGHLTGKIDSHAQSQIHTGACAIYEQWKRNGRIDANMEREARNAANYWRQVLERIVNVTITLATCNLPFRGHRESTSESDINSGNFLSIIQLLARYDPVLKELLERPQGSVKYLSPAIQNEIICIIANRVKCDIQEEIKSAPFFSVIMDTTQDISKIDQLSQVYRYVTIQRDENNNAKDIMINKAFLGFEVAVDTTAAELQNKIVNSIQSNGFDMAKCRGQGYDGAANMSGVYSGVQARIREMEPLAKYVHCAAHNLNLTLNDSVKDITQLRTFYETVEALYVFFGNSIKRWALLSGIIKSDLSEHDNVTLKRLCPTRWSSRHDALTAIRYRYVDVMKALAKIALLSEKKDERNEATALKKKLEDFSFIVLVVQQTKILENVNAVSKMLQTKQVDLHKAVSHLDNIIKTLTTYRNEFDQVKLTAQNLAAKWGANTEFTETRKRKVKRHFDELSEDVRLTNAESYFRINVFNASLDIIISQLSERFTSMRETNNVFCAIHPGTLNNAQDDALYQDAQRLVEHYSRDLNKSFPAELLAFRACFKSEIAKEPTVKELAKMLIVENSTMAASFTEVCTALLLYLTIPVTVAAAERSFSKLKLIKTYLRSSMGQERLSGLAILSIENSRARTLVLGRVVEDFAERKARKMCF